MNIPDKVKVGGITYSVLFLDHVSEDNHNQDGLIMPYKQEIRVKKDMAREYSEGVFLHELFHAILDHCDISFGKKEEHVVAAVSNALYQVLKDNDIDFRQRGQGNE